MRLSRIITFSVISSWDSSDHDLVALSCGFRVDSILCSTVDCSARRPVGRKKARRRSTLRSSRLSSSSTGIRETYRYCAFQRKDKGLARVYETRAGAESREETRARGRTRRRAKTERWPRSARCWFPCSSHPPSPPEVNCCPYSLPHGQIHAPTVTGRF